MDFSSFRGITLRARGLHDEAIFHEVHHRRSRASSTSASSVIQNDLVAILQAAGLCTPPKCATTQPHSSAIHQDERTLLAVLLCQHHVREVINNPAQGDAERGSEFGLEGQELVNKADVASTDIAPYVSGRSPQTLRICSGAYVATRVSTEQE